MPRQYRNVTQCTRAGREPTTSPSASRTRAQGAAPLLQNSAKAAELTHTRAGSSHAAADDHMTPCQRLQTLRPPMTTATPSTSNGSMLGNLARCEVVLSLAFVELRSWAPSRTPTLRRLCNRTRWAPMKAGMFLSHLHRGCPYFYRGLSPKIE